MNIRNYSSSIESSKSISKIENLLVEAGATKISKDYKNGKISGLIFQIIVKDHPFIFKLPSKSETIFKIFSESIKKPRKSTFQNIEVQADRTAWKLLLDWVDVQVSMIRLEQIEVLEVFLPYVYDVKNELTLYEKLSSTNFKLLTN